MEVKKVLRKVVALGAGATMVGATLFSALAAADLGTFPAPFVKDGVFNALIVVGDKAMSEDVVGAVDIGASMQFALKTESPVSVGGADVLISSGIKIKGTGSQVLNYNESIGKVRTTALDDIDMPVTLAQGRYTESEGANSNDVTYTQTVLLNDSNGIAQHDQPDDGYNMDDYLEISDTAPLFKYKLEFDDAVVYSEDSATAKTSAGDDLDGTTLEIQGNTYTITQAKLASSGALDEITMMAGETLLWLTQDQVITKTVGGVSHEVKVVDVTDAEDSCGVSVDGDVAWISTKSEKTINGVKIGVLDAKAVHAQLQDVDVCEINVGATELKMKNGDNLQLDGQEVRDAKVVFDGTAGSWKGFSIEQTPQDNVYLAKDKEYVDPALGNIKIVMGGVVTPREDIKVDAKGTKQVVIDFTNNDGKLVEVPMKIDTNGAKELAWGNGDNKPLLFQTMAYTCGTSIEQCDNVDLFAVTSGETAHVLEITKVDSGKQTLDLKDLTYGRSWSDQNYTQPIDLGSLGKITLGVSGAKLTATRLIANSEPVGYAQTSYGGNITLLTGQVAATNNSIAAMGVPASVMKLTEKDIDDTTAKTIVVNAEYDNVSDKDTKVTLSDTAFALDVTSNDKTDGDSDIEVYTTAHGTLVEADVNNDKYVDISYPKQEVEVNVFVAPVSAQITTQAGAVTTVTLPKLNVGAARLASEISDYKAQNLIVVGGPCANKVAADVMGVPFEAAGCEAGFTEGKAIIKLVDTGSGNVAMVVAGMTAMDTRRATRVVSNPDAYKDKLVGTEVDVTGTSLSDITVSAPK